MSDSDPITGQRAEDILRRAAQTVAGDRQVTHGDKALSFTAIGQFWSLYLLYRPEPMAPVSARDVAQMMALAKIVRSIMGQPAPDHFLDEAGYAGIAGEMAARE